MRQKINRVRDRGTFGVGHTCMVKVMVRVRVKVKVKHLSLGRLQVEGP